MLILSDPCKSITKALGTLFSALGGCCVGLLTLGRKECRHIPGKLILANLQLS